MCIIRDEMNTNGADQQPVQVKPEVPSVACEIEAVFELPALILEDSAFLKIRLIT
jgi:hypothetical protein